MNLSINNAIELKDYKKKGLLINQEEASYQKLNNSGLYISNLIFKNPNINMEEIINKTGEFYDIPRHLIETDVQSFVTNLIKKGYFLQNEKEVESIHKEANESNCTSNGVWIKLTNRCNLRCKYCYASSGESIEDEITLEEIVSILEILKGEKYQSITLTGGETLLRKDILEIVKKCSEYGRVQLLTNGTLGDKELYQELLRYLVRIQISMDSEDGTYHNQNRGEGAYESTVKRIAYIQEINPEKLSIAMTPTPEYKGDIVKIIKFCIDNYINSLHINCFVPYGRGKDSYENDFNMKDYFAWVDQGYAFLYEYYQETIKKNIPFNFDFDVARDLRMSVYTKGRKQSCGLNKNHISIDSNGDVYLCASLHVSEFRLGSIKEDRIDQIIIKAQNKYGDFSVENLHGCKKCEIKYFCGGGCRAKALHDNNDIYGKEHTCDIYKERVYDLMLK